MDLFEQDDRPDLSPGALPPPGAPGDSGTGMIGIILAQMLGRSSPVPWSEAVIAAAWLEAVAYQMTEEERKDPQTISTERAQHLAQRAGAPIDGVLAFLNACKAKPSLVRMASKLDGYFLLPRKGRDLDRYFYVTNSLRARLGPGSKNPTWINHLDRPIWVSLWSRNLNMWEFAADT